MLQERSIFQRPSRLTSASDYKRVFERAHKTSDRFFTVLWRESEPKGSFPRLGLAISKKSVRRAVDRNRVKRLIRESFRHIAAELPRTDIVVLSRQSAALGSNTDIRRSLNRHWEKLIQHG